MFKKLSFNKVLVVIVTIGLVVIGSIFIYEMSGTVKADSAMPQPPSIDDVPHDATGESIMYGYRILKETQSALPPEYIGNALSCSSCHAIEGRKETAIPLVGVTVAYPQYRSREDRVMSVEDRVNGCMIRSMNGQELPEDSKEMRALVDYITYISSNVPQDSNTPWLGRNALKNAPEPNIARGEELYNKSCIACHASDGSGIGPTIGPALWGEGSFNDGAGLARFSNLVGFIKRNMPLGRGGTLTEQQAADLAGFILSHDRPEFKWKEGDWPKGGKPSDSPY
ncbi:c-type cytochrome [Numidum massiliense]|uniref:c-type cytochrome n=1 Tax=Numidum massiliense TaxID=1522315 RepID=UPI0006D573EA|nr:c-type cytochrome [Numidum massiliense]